MHRNRTRNPKAMELLRRYRNGEMRYGDYLTALSRLGYA